MWLCGHWHERKEYIDETTKRQYRYFGKNEIRIFDKENNKLIIY
jgi:hypothetical protein